MSESEVILSGGSAGGGRDDGKMKMADKGLNVEVKKFFKLS